MGWTTRLGAPSHWKGPIPSLPLYDRQWPEIRHCPGGLRRCFEGVGLKAAEAMEPPDMVVPRLGALVVPTDMYCAPAVFLEANLFGSLSDRLFSCGLTLGSLWSSGNRPTVDSIWARHSDASKRSRSDQVIVR